MKIKNTVIGIAIIILTISVVVYGIGVFYDEPEYSDFCAEFKTQEIIDSSERCEEIGGQWNANVPRLEGTGYCDRDFTCRQDYDNAREKYSRNIFLIALPVGILLIVGGGFIFGLEAVGAGLMGGGVGVILYGVGGFWRYSGEVLKFILSLLGLVAVIWFAYRFNKKKK